MDIIIPLAGISVGIIVLLAVFFWHTMRPRIKMRLSRNLKNLDDPDKIERLLSIFDERKKEPLDYRRGGLITIFVGVGIYFLGLFALGSFLKELITGWIHRHWNYGCWLSLS